MATRKTDNTEAAPVEKKESGVGIKEVAEKLEVTPKSLRARIRRVKGGAQVGRGGRYHWESLTDPALVTLLKELEGSSK